MNQKEIGTNKLQLLQRVFQRMLTKYEYTIGVRWGNLRERVAPQYSCFISKKC